MTSGETKKNVIGFVLKSKNREILKQFHGKGRG